MFRVELTRVSIWYCPVSRSDLDKVRFPASVRKLKVETSPMKYRNTREKVFEAEFTLADWERREYRRERREYRKHGSSYNHHLPECPQLMQNTYGRIRYHSI